MKEVKTVRYEKPTLTSYGLLGVVNGDPIEWEGGLSAGGDHSEGCDSDFDE